MMTAVKDPPVSNGKGDPAAAAAAVAAATGAPVDLPSAVSAFARAIDETKDEVVESDEFVDSIYLAIASKHAPVRVRVRWCGQDVRLRDRCEASGHRDVLHPVPQRHEARGGLRPAVDDRPAARRVRARHPGLHADRRLAVLDEFKDGGRFLRQLLNILNERWFKNGGGAHRRPARERDRRDELLGRGAELEALFDRLAQRIVQEPVKTSTGFKKILRGQLGRDAGATKQLTIVTAPQLAAIHHAVDHLPRRRHDHRRVDQLRKAAEKEKLYMSPRRWGEG
jgi:hypothetical protein